MFKNEQGFTLIEMLVVLMIISLLIILIIPNLGSKSEEVNETGCEALEQIIQTQTDVYYLEHRHYPKNVDDLANKGYITEDQKQCKNGDSFKIEQGKVKKE